MGVLLYLPANLRSLKLKYRYNLVILPSYWLYFQSAFVHKPSS